MTEGTRLCTFCRKLAAFLVAREGLCVQHFEKALEDRPGLRFTRIETWAPKQERRLESNRRSYRKNAEKYQADRRARYRETGERAFRRAVLTPEKIEHLREIGRRSYQKNAEKYRAKRRERYWRQKRGERSMKRMGIPPTVSGCRPGALHVLRSRQLAVHAAGIMERMTGEVTRVKHRGDRSWALERFTGTEWVRG